MNCWIRAAAAGALWAAIAGAGFGAEPASGGIEPSTGTLGTPRGRAPRSYVMPPAVDEPRAGQGGFGRFVDRMKSWVRNPFKRNQPQSTPQGQSMARRATGARSSAASNVDRAAAEDVYQDDQVRQATAIMRDPRSPQPPPSSTPRKAAAGQAPPKGSKRPPRTLSQYMSEERP
jgi:hypothetical protein